MRRQEVQPATPRSFILLDKLLSSRVYRAAYYVHRAVLTAKVALVIAMLACILFVKLVVDNADASPPKPDYAKAYDLAMRCFVVIRADAPQAEQQAKPAFEAAVKLGKLRGFSNARIDDDFRWAISRENVKIVQNESYVTDTMATCRKLGFAS